MTEYSPEDLASYIQQGFVTLDELVNNTDGEFTAKMQLGVEKLLAGSEDEDFKKVMESASIADLQDFLNKYPMGTVAHLDAVRERKHVLEKIPASEPIVEESNGEEEEWSSIKNAGDIKLLEAFKEKYPNTSHLFELNKLITAEKNKEHSRKKSPIILKSMINKANSAEDVCKIIQVLLENKTITIGMLLELIRQDPIICFHLRLVMTSFREAFSIETILASVVSTMGLSIRCSPMRDPRILNQHVLCRLLQNHAQKCISGVYLFPEKPARRVRFSVQLRMVWLPVV